MVILFFVLQMILSNIPLEYIGVVGMIIIVLTEIGSSYAIVASTLHKYTIAKVAVYLLVLCVIAFAEALGHEYVVATEQYPPTSIVETDSSTLTATPLFATRRGLITVIDGQPSISFIGWEHIKQVTHSPGKWTNRAARADNTPIVLGKPIYCFFIEWNKECK
jgi:hypothetical protein